MMPSSAAGTTLTLGKLTVGEQIGQGGFGVVHLATLEGIDRTFAIKFLHPSGLNNEDLATYRKRFFREANLLFGLRHPWITAIYGVGEHAERPYILMEYFEGLDLHQVRAKGGAPSPEKVLPFIERVAAALSHAHERGVVHRDIKPSNLMLSTTGGARVLDFGVAALLDPSGERFTRTGDQVPGDTYSAPELTDNPGLLDARSDVYSLGACWFTLITGRAPKGGRLDAALRRTEGVTPAYADVLLRCLDPLDDRYQSAQALGDAIHGLRLGKSRGAGEPSDDEARLPGALASLCPTSPQWATEHHLKRELGSRLRPLRFTVALHELEKRGFLREEERFDDQTHELYVAFRPSDEGRAWVAANVARIEDLDPVPSSQPSLAAQDDDIPF
jgi:serine/threonine protein kinase